MADDRTFAFDVSGRRRPPPKPIEVLVAGACILGLVVGIGMMLAAGRDRAARSIPSSGTPSAVSGIDASGAGTNLIIPILTSAPLHQEGNPGLPMLPATSPMSIRIPAIGVSTPLIPLGLLPDGSLQTPPNYGVAGWWSGGPTPGQIGAAVIVGHVDSTAGPAVFYRLRELGPGDLVWVTGKDGVPVAFVVRRLEQVPKSHFPTKQVYGPQPYRALRLITCGGAFDRSTGHYVDDLIVFADAA